MAIISVGWNDQTLVASPDGSIVAGFGIYGLCAWTTSSSWQLLSGLNDQTLVASPDGGSIVAVFRHLRPVVLDDEQSSWVN